jgi:hypothetical protein
MILNTSFLSGQFVLCQDLRWVPNEWHRVGLDTWHLSTHASLPVLKIMTNLEQQVGWIIGYPISLQSKTILTKDIIFPFFLESKDKAKYIERFLYQFAGRFVAIFILKGFQRLYLDAAGSLAVVYSLDHAVVASTCSVLGKNRRCKDWDQELVSRFPWYPFGFTPHKSIRRLLPNHYLDLSDWRSVRHWPVDLDIDDADDTDERIKGIAAVVSDIVSAVVASWGYLTLTGGMDTRMILACSKDVLDKAMFFTSNGNKIDVNLAKLLAKRFNLNHIIVDTTSATKVQREERLFLSGYCVDHRSLSRYGKHREKLDASRVQLAGHPACGKAFGYKNLEIDALNAEKLVRVIKLPFEKRVIEKAEKWLSEFVNLRSDIVLELAYLEQRVGCWAGPNAYSYDHLALPVIYAFAHRDILENMITLPNVYKKKQQMPIDICKLKWADILDVPFNQFTGIRKVISVGIDITKMLLRPFERPIKDIIRKFDNYVRQ